MGNVDVLTLKWALRAGERQRLLCQFYGPFYWDGKVKKLAFSLFKPSERRREGRNPKQKKIRI